MRDEDENTNLKLLEGKKKRKQYIKVNKNTLTKDIFIM